MKKINNEQILDIIYDLADMNGIRIDELIERIEEEFGEQLPELDGIPEEIAEELKTARESKKEMRKQNRQKESEKETEAEIKVFRELFPEVATDEIPDEVWEDVAKGASLSHAYSLFLVKNEMLKKHAEGINERNSEKGAFANSDGSTEPVFTKEQVEKMSGKDVKSNYKGILKAMKNWRF